MARKVRIPREKGPFESNDIFDWPLGPNQDQSIKPIPSITIIYLIDG